MRKLFGCALLFALIGFMAAPAQAQYTGKNWSATFYNNTSLSSPVATESYPHGLYFNWGESSPRKADASTPVPGVSSDFFSISFTSTQTFSQGGIYRFLTYVDDGVRVYVNDELMVDEFNPNETDSHRTFTFDRNIEAGEALQFRVDYVEYTGSAILVFQWGVIAPPNAIVTFTPLDNSTLNNDATPAFTWQHVGAQSYVFRIWPVGGSTLMQAAYPTSAICDTSICTLDFDALPRRAALALKNGRYAWRIKTQGLATTVKSPIAEFKVDYPGKPLSLTPDFGTSAAGPSPVLKWGDVALADQYRVVLTRVKTGAVIKTGWLTDFALGCDAVWCTLDLSALQPPVVLKRGKYTWQVFARTTAHKANVSKSAVAAFKVVPPARAVQPPPALPEGFRTP